MIWWIVGGLVALIVAAVAVFVWFARNRYFH